MKYSVAALSIGRSTISRVIFIKTFQLVLKFEGVLKTNLGFGKSGFALMMMKFNVLQSLRVYHMSKSCFKHSTEHCSKVKESANAFLCLSCVLT
jgi:hypothetical protein